MDAMSVSSTYGFLNPDAATVPLPPIYDELIAIAETMGLKLRQHELRPLFDQAAPIPLPGAQASGGLSPAQTRRLFAIYGMLASGYLLSIHEDAAVVKTLPASLAVPLHALAARLDVPPILNYDAYVLSNFAEVLAPPTPPRDADADAGDSDDGCHDCTDCRADKPTAPAAIAADPAAYLPESYRPLLTFAAADDAERAGEEWFVAVHVAIERLLGPPLARLPGMRALLAQLDDASSATSEIADPSCPRAGATTSRSIRTLATFLADLASRLRAAAATLGRMGERLSPALYVATTRRYVAPFDGVVFGGVPELRGEPQYLRGETGGQSPLPRALEAFLGVKHGGLTGGGRGGGCPAAGGAAGADGKEGARVMPVGCGGDMQELGEYMHPGHREFVASLRKGTTLHEYVASGRWPELAGGFRGVVEGLAAFRAAHIKLAGEYLVSRGVRTGTGRSVFSDYLGANLRDTRALLRA